MSNEQENQEQISKEVAVVETQQSFWVYLDSELDFIDDIVATSEVW